MFHQITYSMEMIDSFELYQLYILPESTHALNHLILYLKRNTSLSLQIGSDSEVSELQILIREDNSINAHLAYDYLIANEIDTSRVYFNSLIRIHRPFYRIIRSNDVFEDFSDDTDDKKKKGFLIKAKDILIHIKSRIFRRNNL